MIPLLHDQCRSLIYGLSIDIQFIEFSVSFLPNSNSEMGIERLIYLGMTTVEFRHGFARTHKVARIMSAVYHH